MLPQLVKEMENHLVLAKQLVLLPLSTFPEPLFTAQLVTLARRTPELRSLHAHDCQHQTEPGRVLSCFPRNLQFLAPFEFEVPAGQVSFSLQRL